MARPQVNRLVGVEPKVTYFSPRGVPVVSLEEVCLTVDEWESIRLSDLLGLSYEESGKRMGISRATFSRIIQNAREAIADAILNGKAIKVEGGNFTLAETS